MSKHRIYIEGPIEAGRLMTIRGEQARYIRRVLRLRKDDALTLFDGTNGEFPAVIKTPGKDVVEVETGPRIDRSVESPFSITLLQGISRGDRMEHVVQKATEIGVSKIVPVLTDTRSSSWTKSAPQNVCSTGAPSPSVHANKAVAIAYRT